VISSTNHTLMDQVKNVPILKYNTYRLGYNTIFYLGIITESLVLLFNKVILDCNNDIALVG